MTSSKLVLPDTIKYKAKTCPSRPTVSNTIKYKATITLKNSVHRGL